MLLRAGPAGPWALAAGVSAAHVAAFLALSRLDAQVAPPEPPALQVEVASPEPPPADPRPPPDQGPSPLPEATSLPASPVPLPADPEPVVASNADPSPQTESASSEVPPQGDPSPGAPAAVQPPGEGGVPGDGEGETLAEASDYLANPAPGYPLASRLLGEEGRVLLRVLVDTAGKSHSVSLHQSSGHARLDGSALSAVWSWKFHPARRGGKPVQAWVVVPIRFSLKGA